MLRLSVKNFQSLEDVLIDVKGLTILRGESGVGKSAVIRCVRALLQNRWGRGMIRNGSKFCDVAVDFCDGNKLLARKTSENMVYRMVYSDGTIKDYTAMRREVPEEMGKVFGLTVFDDGTSKELLQIRGQYDRPLLIEVTHKRLSGMLGDGSEWVRCVNVDKLVHSWLGIQKGRERGLKEMEDASEERISKMEGVLAQLKKLKDTTTEKYENLERLYTRYEDLCKLRDICSSMVQLTTKLSSLKKITELLPKVSVANERVSNLMSLSNVTKQTIGFEGVNGILGKVKECAEKMERLNTLNSLSNLCKEIESGRFSIDDLHSRLSSDVCPVCGAKLQ